MPLAPKELEMKVSKIVRDLADLDKLEARIKQTTAPSAVLLKEIQRRKDALLQGVDPDAPAQTQPGK